MDGEIAQRSGDEADKEMTRLWRTWRTVYEMLSDRVSFIPRDPSSLNGLQILQQSKG